MNSYILNQYDQLFAIYKVKLNSKYNKSHKLYLKYCKKCNWVPGTRYCWANMQTSLPEQLQTDSKSAGPPRDGVSTPQEVPLETARRPPDWTLLGGGWHDWTSNASHSRGGGDGLVATCNRSGNCLAGWYTQWSPCCPYGPEHPCPDGALWGGPGQGILPIDMKTQLGTRPYPWHCLTIMRGSPASGRGIREYHRMPGYLLQVHSWPKERGICPRAEDCVAGHCNLNPVSTVFPRLARDSAMEPVLKRSHMEQTERNYRHSCSHMPQELLRKFQWDRRPAW